MDKINKVVGSILIGFITVFPLVSCSKEGALPEAKGYQWEVTKEGKKMYLMGTIHVTDTKHNYLTENIIKILDESDKLATEIDMLDPDTTSEIQESGMYVDGETIESELTSKEIEMLKSLSSDINVDYNILKTIKPSGIISNITLLYYMKAGCMGEAVDTTISTYMKNKNKDIVPLETVKSQIDLLNKMQGIDVLKEYLKEYKPGSFDEIGKNDIDQARELSNMYIEGNEKYIEDAAIEMKEEDEAVYEMLLKERNKKMVVKIEEFFKEDKIYTIAVGSLHFYGDDGIIKLLESKGYNIKKI